MIQTLLPDAIVGGGTAKEDDRGLSVTVNKHGRFMLAADSTGSRLRVGDGGRSVCFSEELKHETPLPAQASFCEGPRMMAGTGVHFFEVLIEAAPAATSASLRGRAGAKARLSPVLAVGVSKLLPGAWHCCLGRTSASWCFRSDGTVASADVVTPYGESYGAGDRVGVEVDATAGTVRFFLNRSPVGWEGGAAFRHIDLGGSGIVVPAVGLANHGERVRLGDCWEGTFLGSNEAVKAAKLAAELQKTPRDENYVRWNQREDGSGAFEFHHRWKGERLVVGEGKMAVRHTDDFPQTAFVAGPVCKEGKRFFEIECVHCKGRVGSPEHKFHLIDWCASVGVARVVAGSWRIGLGSTLTGWAYRCDGSKMRNDSTKTFGPPFCTGDIIGMELDMNAGTVRMYRNGRDLGVMFAGLQGETLTPAVGLAHHDDCFRLLSWWEGGRGDRLKRVKQRFNVKGLQAFGVGSESIMHAQRLKHGSKLTTDAHGSAKLPQIKTVGDAEKTIVSR